MPRADSASGESKQVLPLRLAAKRDDRRVFDDDPGVGFAPVSHGFVQAPL